MHIKHHTATVFLISNTTPHRVLLIHHKKFQLWMPPGGHQEEHENYYEAAIRETREETGIDIRNYFPTPEIIDERATSLPLPYAVLEERIDQKNDQPEHFHLDSIFVVYIPYQTIVPQENESENVKWFSQEEIDSLALYDNVRVLIKKIFSSSNSRKDASA